MEPYEDTPTTFISIKTDLITETIKNANRVINYIESILSYHIRDSKIITPKDKEIRKNMELKIENLKETIKKLELHI